MNLIKLLAVLAVVPLLIAARPGSEAQLVQQLNGQPVRPVMPDGGAWGIFTAYDGGAANSFGCAPLTGLRNNVGAPVTANVLVFFPLVPANVCVMPSINGPLWDGGCNTDPASINYGWPLQVNVPQYLTPDNAATRICAVSDAGYLSIPLGWAQ